MGCVACGSTWFCGFRAAMKEGGRKCGLLVGECWKIFPPPQFISSDLGVISTTAGTAGSARAELRDKSNHFSCETTEVGVLCCEAPCRSRVHAACALSSPQDGGRRSSAGLEPHAASAEPVPAGPVPGAGRAHGLPAAPRGSHGPGTAGTETSPRFVRAVPLCARRRSRGAGGADAAWVGVPGWC